MFGEDRKPTIKESWRAVNETEGYEFQFWALENSNDTQINSFSIFLKN